MIALRVIFLVCLVPIAISAQTRIHARDLGVAPGVFRPGPLNAITDVSGVRVGQRTIVEGDSIRTGVTAIFPHEGNPFLERVPAAVYVGNAFGKLLGSTQVNELGELETPILLTCTLCVWKAADVVVGWMLDLPGMAEVHSINPLVAETNDGSLNAIRSRPVSVEAVRAALTNAKAGPVEEGSVGAGTGTGAFSWKGGIGTSSRVLPKSLGGYSLGVLVQTNFGGVLQILGAPVGKELGKYAYKEQVDRDRGDGSIIMVVATDAPLSDRNLRRLAARAIMGLARTGSSASDGSGDYVIAFSTAGSVRRHVSVSGTRLEGGSETANPAMSPLFEAVIEATEEAIYNSMFMATTVTSRFGTTEALPMDRVKEILRKYHIGVAP